MKGLVVVAPEWGGGTVTAIMPDVQWHWRSIDMAYITISKKATRIPWEEERLNRTAEFV